MGGERCGGAGGGGGLGCGAQLGGAVTGRQRLHRGVLLLPMLPSACRAVRGERSPGITAPWVAQPHTALGCPSREPGRVCSLPGRCEWEHAK